MRRRHAIDWIARRAMALAAFSAVAVLAGIFLMLMGRGLRVFAQVDPLTFFTSPDWNPAAFGEAAYGTLSLLASSLLVTMGAMLLAVPLGIAVAAFLSEVAPPRLRAVVKPLVELLAAVPSVAAGFFGIVFLGPFLARLFGLNNGFNALNGSLLLAFMSLPTIVTVAEDAIHSVPQSFKEASYALGASRWATLLRVTLPASLSGIIAACVLGMGRAIGETMTVLMATGNAAAMPGGLLDPVRTLTATIAIELGEVAYGTTHYYSLFALGAWLFLISLGVNLLAENLAARFRYRLQ